MTAEKIFNFSIPKILIENNIDQFEKPEEPKAIPQEPIKEESPIKEEIPIESNSQPQMNNDQKIRNYKKKQFEKWIIISLYLLVIVLEFLALFNIIDMLWGVALFAIIYLFKKIYLK